MPPKQTQTKPTTDMAIDTLKDAIRHLQEGQQCNNDALATLTGLVQNLSARFDDVNPFADSTPPHSDTYTNL